MVIPNILINPIKFRKQFSKIDELSLGDLHEKHNNICDILKVNIPVIEDRFIIYNEHDLLLWYNYYTKIGTIDIRIKDEDIIYKSQYDFSLELILSNHTTVILYNTLSVIINKILSNNDQKGQIPN